MELSHVAKHNSYESLRVIIHGNVYDLTKFASLHPGGRNVLLKVAGKDATKEFDSYHNHHVLSKYSKMIVGTVKNAIIKQPVFIQYSDPSYLQGRNSLYYKKSHFALAKELRDFIDKECIPNVYEWEENLKMVPQEVRNRFVEIGLLKCACGKWPIEYAGEYTMANIHVDEYDIFHSLIINDEMNRMASFGVSANLFGFSIALPPILKFGSKFLKDLVARDVYEGNKMICLCITEPYTGSDVSGIKTTATRTPDGKHYIITGEKKFITNGIWCDFFVVACKTEKGFSMFLVDRAMGGVTTKRMWMQGSYASGTTYITFDHVKVPATHLIGKENQAFLMIMTNFNTERWGIIVQSLRFARVCYEDAFTYTNKRVTFGKKLIENDVIRSKLGVMASSIEGCFAWLENITFQMHTMDSNESNLKLSGVLSLLKVQATQVLEMCARESLQIFGGKGYTKTGEAERCERIYRDVRVLAIGGGSEEIMTDFAIRQAVKQSKL